MPECMDCHRTLLVGDTAWASDWTVIGVDTQAETRTETRYTCDDCEAKR